MSSIASWALVAATAGMILSTLRGRRNLLEDCWLPALAGMDSGHILIVPVIILEERGASERFKDRPISLRSAGEEVAGSFGFGLVHPVAASAGTLNRGVDLSPRSRPRHHHRSLVCGNTGRNHIGRQRNLHGRALPLRSCRGPSCRFLRQSDRQNLATAVNRRLAFKLVTTASPHFSPAFYCSGYPGLPTALRSSGSSTYCRVRLRSPRSRALYPCPSAPLRYETR